MEKDLERDLKKLENRAYHAAEWAEDVLRRFHSSVPNLQEGQAVRLRVLYDWMFVPLTLWPFNIHEMLNDLLAVLVQRKRLSRQQCMIIDLLPKPPDETICEAVADHERHVESGTYENLVKTQTKFSQTELNIKTDPDLQYQWESIKATLVADSPASDEGIGTLFMATF